MFMEKKPYAALVPLFVAALAASAALALFLKPLWVGLLSAALVVACFGIGLVIIGARWRQLQQECDDIFLENSSAASSIINTIDVPALIFDDSGRIIWSNEAMDEIYAGRDIKKILPSLDTHAPAQATTLEFNGKAYQIMCSPIKREHPSAHKLTFQYWLDRTEALHYTRLYEENMPVVALIYVDNYEELNADKQFQRNSVLSEVEGLVSKFTSSIQGTYRRYENARFFLIFEAKYMDALEKERFKLLELAHAIDTGTEQTVTLSIAVGAESQVAHSDESARQAMELALGRGGDQAVVKRGTNYAFFGGQKQIALTRQSRVKARLFAKALRQLMENSDTLKYPRNSGRRKSIITAPVTGQFFSCMPWATRRCCVRLPQQVCTHFLALPPKLNHAPSSCVSLSICSQCRFTTLLHTPVLLYTWLLMASSSYMHLSFFRSSSWRSSTV